MVDIPLDAMFEDAFYGVGYQGERGPFAVYDINRCIEILLARGISEVQAIRMMSHTTLSKWEGNPHAPIFIQGLPIDKIEAFKQVVKSADEHNWGE